MTTPPTIQLRPLRAADARALGDLFAAAAADRDTARFFHPFPLTRRQAADLCERAGATKDRYFVLAVGDRLAGLGMLRGWADGYAVPSFGVCVHPRAQGTAAGHALTAYAVREAKRAGSRQVRLTVYRENTRAAHLYRRYGFRYAPKPSRPDELVGTLDLAAADGKPLRPLAEGKLAAWHAAEAARPFRVGVWCAYGKTLGPHDGIGVFAYNLVRGLAAHPDRPEVVVVTRPGDEHLLAEAADGWGDRVRVAPAEADDLPPPTALDRAAHRGRLALRAVLRGGVHTARWVRRRLVRPVRQLVDEYPLVVIPALPVALLEAYLRAAVRPAVFVLRRIARYADYVPPVPGRVSAHKSAACDVWVYPYCQLPFPVSDHPAVVFVHDLVCSRFPEYFTPDGVTTLERMVRQTVGEATTVACMSEFIRRNDLLGLLGLPEGKVRMVRPAPPADFPAESVGVEHLVPAGAPFLFYPAGLRGYKNHQLLLEAVARLGHDAPPFHLVFTGGGGGGEEAFHRPVRRLAERLGLDDRVHILGKISREELAGLYQAAFATVVPSLYEQGSFPLYEALHYGCPVAAADIPPLREQCDGLGSAMLYFDPHDPDSCAAALRALAADRRRVTAAQTTAAAALWQRTWPEVAGKWLEVFREAADRFTAPPPPPAQPVLAPGRPPRIGVWLDYHGTLEPTEGIGVHIHALMHGLLDHPDRVELTVAGKWGQEAALRELVRRGGDRVRVLPAAHQRLADPVTAAEGAGCHLWILPYAGMARFPNVPSAVILHDMVTAVHPEGFEPHAVAELDREVRKVVTHCKAVVCLTDTLAEAEAGKLLRLPKGKARVIRPAATRLPPDGRPADPKVLEKLTRPFLFYPGAFRPYKNHAALVHALRLLREEHGEYNLDLVFTGAHPHLPDHLAGLPGADALKGHIHVLGRVSRATIDALYDRAAALVFPSRYEGCGLPAYEAVDRGCPIALSDLPVFREQFAAFGDAVPYFDPDRPRELVRVLLDLLPRRDEVKAAQQAHRAGLMARTWQDVAADWVELVRELAAGPASRPALHLHRPAEAA